MQHINMKNLCLMILGTSAIVRLLTSIARLPHVPLAAMMTLCFLSIMPFRPSLENFTVTSCLDVANSSRHFILLDVSLKHSTVKSL